MKVALCFSGQTRTLEKSWSNIKTCLVDPISCYSEVDLFGVFPDKNRFLDSLYWKDIIIKDDDIFSYSHRMSMNTRNMPEKTNGLLNMWNNWKISIELCKKSTASPYDWVFRVRPDSWFMSEIDDLRLLNSNSLYIPNHDNWGGYNDRFAFGGEKSMSCYASLVDSCEKYFDSGLQFHVETYLKHHLDIHKINIERSQISLSLLRDTGIQQIYQN